MSVSEGSIVEISVPTDHVEPAIFAPELRRVPLDELDGETGYVICDCGPSAIVHVWSVDEPIFLPAAWLT